MHWATRPHSTAEYQYLNKKTNPKKIGGHPAPLRSRAISDERSSKCLAESREEARHHGHTY